MVENKTEQWSRFGPATVVLLLLNAVGFVVLTMSTGAEEILGLPAGWDELSRKPWTALTVLFTSGSAAHFLAAVVVIVLAGGALERRVGPAHVLAVYLLSGLAASLAMATAVSLGAQSTPTSLGASGAFLGLVTALAVMPSPITRVDLAKVVAVLVVINVLAPLAGVGDWTSTVAHLAGMAVGALYGLTIRARARHPA